MNEVRNVRTQITDPETGTVYIVMAFRKLTYEEMIQAAQYHLENAGEKPAPGSEVIIIGNHGMNGGE